METLIEHSSEVFLRTHCNDPFEEYERLSSISMSQQQKRQMECVRDPFEVYTNKRPRKVIDNCMNVYFITA